MIKKLLDELVDRLADALEKAIEKQVEAKMKEMFTRLIESPKIASPPAPETRGSIAPAEVVEVEVPQKEDRIVGTVTYEDAPRTGRGGSGGIAWSMLTDDQVQELMLEITNEAHILIGREIVFGNRFRALGKDFSGVIQQFYRMNPGRSWKSFVDEYYAWKRLSR